MKRVMWLLIVLLIPLALLCVPLAPAQYDETFLGALRDKCDLLDAPGEKPRIVIIGGSGAAFGQDSELLETLLPGYSAVNFGMYAGLGTAVMLDLAEDRLRPGDVVVFTPEQSEQTLSMFFNARSMWQAADGRIDLLTRLRPDDLKKMAGAWGGFAADKLQCMQQGKPALGGVYRRSALNRWGDVAADRPGNTMPGGWDVNMPIRFDSAWLNEDFAAHVRSVAARCREKGVTFLYRVAPVNALAVQGGDIGAFAAHVENALGCPILGEPQNAVMEPGWFYDTNFHLNTAGARVNTVRLAQELAEHLHLPPVGEVALPEIPAMQQTALVDGDSSDAALFLWEAQNGAIRLTALSGEGKARECITVPVSIEGMPVTSFAAEVFAGNEVIREIIVQGSVARLEDGAFSGCRALERICLTHAVPADCPVGGGLLDGTDALVYVPADSLGAYLTNYFWAVHGERIRAAGERTEKEETVPVQTPGSHQRAIRYEGNGGTRHDGSTTLLLPIDDAHLRMNTAPGTRYFTRDGYLLTGWNTAPDGTGEQIGLGHRTARRETLTLYAQWTKTDDPADYTWREERGEIHITGYHGTADAVTVPSHIGGMPVTRICRGAFADAAITSATLPPTLFAVERGAFDGCKLQALTLYDSLYYIYDESFAACRNLQTLTIHAATPPVWSGTYFDTFPDKMDWLMRIRDERKIVLFSGSSARFGYDCEAIRAAFPAYQAANMGVYAYTNALPQLDLINDLMNEGDILLSAPEFDTVRNQFCLTRNLDEHFFAMVEGDYALVSRLDLRAYRKVFDALGKYLNIRSAMSSGSYAVSPNGYDDDYNAYPFDTYNRYGDLILPRPGSEQDVLLQHGLADYTVAGIPKEVVVCLNEAYVPFLEKGVRVYFSYTPRNWSSLTPESTPEARAQLHEHLKKHLTVPVISEIEDYLYPGTYFYLIDSHLSTEGVQLRTQRIIRDLQRQIEREKLAPKGET